MSSSYFPARDADALIFMQTFASGIAADYSTYFLSASDSAQITNAVNAFAAALADARDPDQRTPTNVAIKDEARNAAEQLVRQYATQIKFNAGIPNPAKISIGVRPVNPERNPITCPQTSPIISIVAATPGAQTLKFADTLVLESGKKPFGASEIQLFVAIENDTVSDPNEARFYGKFTKNPLVVAFNPADNGKQATYFARWAGRRGDTGPWSAPATMAIAA